MNASISEPTAASVEVWLGIAELTIKATAAQPGKTRRGARRIGLTSTRTSASTQPASRTTYAKPIAEQIGSRNFASASVSTVLRNTTPGSPAIAPIKSAVASNTARTS